MEEPMTRAILPALAAGLLAAVACSGPAPKSAAPTPGPAATAVPGPLVVGVVAADASGSGVDAWAKELRDAVRARAGELRLAADGETTDIVVRLEKLEQDVKFTPEPPGEGRTAVVRGTFLLGPRTREFRLGYRGEARPQAEALARNLRTIAKEMATSIPEPLPKPVPSK
jgi:hypothetical protein